MKKIILTGDAAKRKIGTGVQKLVDIVASTIGPKGRNCVLSGAYGQPLITNDGATIAGDIILDDELENVGAQVLKQVCVRTNDVAGDGTTTACILAGAMVRDGIKNVVAGANPIILRSGIEKATEKVLEYLAQVSQPVTTGKAINEVASISAGSIDVGSLIEQAYSHVGLSGIVTARESRGMKTELKIEQGMSLPRGYISHYMCTDMDKMEADVASPYILITDKKISHISDLIGIIEKVAAVDGTLLIIADEIDGEALSTLVMNKLRGVFRCVCVRAPSYGDGRKSILDDVALYTGARVISGMSGVRTSDIDLTDLGRCESVKVTKDTTTIIGGGGKASDIKDRVRALSEQRSKSNDRHAFEALSSRIASLNGMIAVIYVGATSEIELGEKQLRIEDALNATKSAIEEGIVAGGGVSLAKSCRVLAAYISTLSGEERIGATIVYNALTEPIRQIAVNAGVDAGVVCNKVCSNKNIHYGYDAMKNVYGDMLTMGIIDPVKVTRSGLQNASSVASTLLTTDSMVITVEKSG